MNFIQNEQSLSLDLLKICADGRFHSLESLCLQLQITSAKLRQVLQILDHIGMEIEWSIGHGYRILGGLELLDRQQIVAELHPQAQALLESVIILDQVDSTNNYLLQKTITSTQAIAVFAEQQTQGKGQRGKIWASPFGNNIYHSILWNFKKNPREILGLSLAIAIATTRALQRYGVRNGLGVKWPNDVYYLKQKLVGILVETSTETAGYCRTVVGVGVNLHLNPQQSAAINQPWTSLQKIMGKKIQRNRFAGLLLNELLTALALFEHQGLTPFLAEWRKLDYLYGKKTLIYNVNESIQGIMQGISPRGELLLLDEHNQQHSFLNGSVKVIS